MPNTTAYVVLFSWPLVVFLLFRILPRAEALAWSIIGGYLALPHGVGIDLPAVPTFDKTLIPALSAAVMCLLGVAPSGMPARRTASGPPSDLSPPAPDKTLARAEAGAGSAFTRQKTRHIARGAALPAPVEQREVLGLPRIILLLMVLLFATQGLTFLQNRDFAQTGVVILPGLRAYDMFSMMLNTGVMLLPFFLGLRYLGTVEEQSVLLRVFCVAALIYSLPTLFEIRMSPQLSRWIYGFLAQLFDQAMRGGGFRPVVFLQHGLWLALFMAMAALAGLALWRQRSGGKLWLWAALWLVLVLALSRSLGAFAVLLALMPVALLLSIRAQLLVAALLAVVVLIYPMLRGGGLAPVTLAYSMAASVSQERAESLKFRFDNEDVLLARANEKPMAGWGGYGRSRVFDPETGRDISVTDGSWIIVMGNSGWLGYIGTFGLLVLPVILLFLGVGHLGVTQATAGLCLVLGANLVDMIANATLTPLTWLIAGALAGRCRFRIMPPQDGPVRGGPPAPRPAGIPPRRRDRSGLRRMALAMTLLFPLIGTPARADLSNPTLSFGLTGISDWSTQMPFLDLMKMSRPWIGHSATNWSAMSVAQLEAGGYLDADGWPMSIPAGLTSVGTIWDWSGSSAADPAAAASRAGIYVLEYEGTGTLQIQGVTILSSEPGRIVVQNVSGGSMLLNITSTDPSGTGDYIRNVTLVAQEYETLHEMGQIFNPEWLALVEDARELRFMDWMQTNGATSAEWADRPRVDDVTWRSVPVEVMVELANQTGTEPWFTIPAGASEEYIRKFATYVRDHLNPDLEVHVEYSNEMWNWAFPQTQWLAAQATAEWGVASGGPEWLDYAAMLATKAALIWDEVFGAEADHRVDNVLGSHTVNAWAGKRLLNAPMWQAKDPTGYVAPHSVFDSLAIATYFGYATMSDANLRTELLNVLKTPGIDAMAWLGAKLMDPDYPGSIPQAQSWWVANKEVVDQYGIDLIAYEGGSHVLHSFAVGGLSAADLETLTTFLTEFTRSEEMAELYHALWTGWAAVSDGPFMQFGDVASASKFGAWGLFSALGDSNPRANLLMDLNANSTAWFETR